MSGRRLVSATSARSDSASFAPSSSGVTPVDLVREMVAEFVGSFLLVFVTFGGVLVAALLASDVVTIDRTMYTTLLYGLTYGATVYCLSFPSSDTNPVANTRHLNPAVTVAVYFAQKSTPLVTAVLYVLSQIVGAAIAVLVLFSLKPFEHRGELSTYPLLEDANELHSALASLFTSTIVVLTILLTSFGGEGRKQPSLTDAVQEQAAQSQHEINSILSGAVVFATASFASSLSGGYFNPLFPLGISIFAGTFKLIPFLVPFGGALIALLISKIPW